MGKWRLIKQKYSLFTSLSSEERQILIQAFFMLPIVRLSRRRFLRSLQKVHCSTTLSSTVKTVPDVNTLITARQAARMVSIAANYAPHRSSCLDRSFLLWALLRKRGIDSELLLGARKDQGSFKAHAWVEINGEVLNDTNDVREKFSLFPGSFAAFDNHFQ